MIEKICLFFVLAISFCSCQEDDYYDGCMGVNCPDHNNSGSNGNNSIGGWEDGEKRDSTKIDDDKNNTNDKENAFEITVKKWGNTVSKDINF